MLILALLSNKGVRRIKMRPFLISLILCLGSWIGMFIVTADYVLNE